MSELATLSSISPKAPYYVSWEITHRCDARCLHCYASAGPEVDGSGELSTAEALGVIDQLVDAGSPMLAFSGGEPTLRPDWLQLIRYAVSRNLVVTVVTNGSTIGAEQAKELNEIGVESVTVSLDSHRAELHDKIRNKPGLHDAAVNAIRHLTQHGIRVVVNYTPMRLNWGDLTSTAELAQQLGVATFSLSEFVPAGRGSEDMKLTTEETQELLETWKRLRAQTPGDMALVADDRTTAMLRTSPASPDCPDCGAARSAARILPDGTVTPCPFVPVPLGSFRHEKFQELWQRSPIIHDVRARAGEIGINCSTCGMMTRNQAKSEGA